MAAQVSSVHEVAPVSESPHVTLVRWRVIQDLPAGERHLVGWNVEACEGRASTCVVHIDDLQLLATTRSGRVYQLKGPPAHDADADYVWHAWLRINHATEGPDVTAQVWTAHLACVASRSSQPPGAPAAAGKASVANTPGAKSGES